MPLKVNADGAYAIRFGKDILFVRGNGDGTLSDYHDSSGAAFSENQSGPVRHTGKCQRVGGL